MRGIAIGFVMTMLATLSPAAAALPGPVDPDDPVRSTAIAACRFVPGDRIGDFPVPYALQNLHDAVDDVLYRVNDLESWCMANAESFGDFGIELEATN